MMTYTAKRLRDEADMLADFLDAIGASSISDAVYIMRKAAAILERVESLSRPESAPPETPQTFEQALRGEMRLLQDDVDHWNRHHPDEEPIVIAPIAAEEIERAKNGQNKK